LCDSRGQRDNGFRCHSPFLLLVKKRLQKGCPDVLSREFVRDVTTIEFQAICQAFSMRSCG